MNGIRSFSKGLAVFLLFFTLLALPVVMSIQMTVNSSSVVNDTISKSGIYDSFTTTDMLLENSRLSPVASSSEVITAALNDSITPSYVKNSSEKLIDAVYAYVHGDVDTLDLAVDVSDVKTRFADNVAARIQQKFEGLSVCTESKIASTSIESLLEASCAPIGMSPQQASDYAKAEIMNTTLFSNDRLDLAGLAGTRESSLATAMTDLRTVYPYFMALVYGLPILSLILAVGILLLSGSRRRGVKSLANTLLSVGIINASMALIVTWLVGIFMSDSVPGETVASGFEKILPSLLGNFTSWWLGVSVALLGVSILLYIILGVTRPPELEPKSQPLPPAPQDQLTE